MAKSDPKWKRSGFDTSGDYQAACARCRAAKEDALRGTAARCGSARLLEYLVRRSDWHNMTVITTKPQIMEDLRMGRKTVQRALAFLREEGTIQPVENFKGGKTQGGAGLPVVYRIVPQGVQRTLPEREPRGGEPRRVVASQMTADETREFSLLVDRHGYAEARSIMKLRRGE